MHRYQILFLFVFTIFIACTDHKKIEQKHDEQPNIVFIFTDDQTYSSIHALGNQDIKTPAMDRMVEEGTTFTHAFNMGSWSGAVCAASRAMLNSGRSVWRANKFRENWVRNDSVELSWGKIMEQHGYETYMTGKWHVDAPAESMYINVTHVRPGMPNDAWDHETMVAKFDSLSRIKNGNPDDLMPIGYNRPLSEKDTFWSPTDEKFGGFWEGGKHWSEVLKDDAISYINQAKESDKPFFMYLAFNAPHDPRQAPQEYQDMYKEDEIEIPRSFLSEYPYRHHIANGNDLRDEALAPFPRSEYAVKKHIKEYYASITHVDAQISLILDALKKSGKMENTYVFLSADHGLAMGRHGFMGKQNLYDHSIRPPLVIIGPDIPKNERNSADVYLQDIMATSLNIAGINKPSYVDFHSFLDLARNKDSQSNYEAIYGAYLSVQRMIRKDGYKLIVYPEIDKIRLYNLMKDPDEMNDLADRNEEKERIKSLFEDLLQLQIEMEDTLDIRKTYKTL